MAAVLPEVIRTAIIDVAFASTDYHA